MPTFHGEQIQVEHDPDSIGDSPVPDLMAQPCYLDEHRQAASEWNLELFCREILVPLAIETKALVIGNCFADDALYMAFCKAAEAVKAKYSGKLPFTTFGMADAPCLSMACVTDGTTTRKMFDSCISWRQRYAKVPHCTYAIVTWRGSLVIIAERGEFSPDPGGDRQEPGCR
jgi:hypothetical protein